MSCFKCEYKDFLIESLTKLVEDLTGRKLPPLPPIPEEKKVEYDTKRAVRILTGEIKE